MLKHQQIRIGIIRQSVAIDMDETVRFPAHRVEQLAVKGTVASRNIHRAL